MIQKLFSVLKSLYIINENDVNFKNEIDSKVQDQMSKLLRKLKDYTYERD